MSAGGEVVVIGGGLAGLNAAWFLHRAGMRVRVIERRDDVALETSYANSGMMTPSMSDPWNAPGVHWQLLRWLGRRDAPMLLRPRALPQYLGWGLRFLWNSRPRRHLAATEANLALSIFSLQQVRALRDELPLDYALGTRGTIKIYRDEAAFGPACIAAEHLRDQGLRFETMDGFGAARAEPQLQAIRHRIAGAIHFPGDETGDAHAWCRGLRQALEQRGVAFTLGCEVRRIVLEQGRVRGLETSAGAIDAAQIVLAAAAYSPALAEPLGVRLHIRPVKGYSLSVPLTDPQQQLSMSVIDDALHTAATPLGQVLRVAGTAEFCGFDPALDEARLQNLWNFLQALNPSMHAAADRERTTSWCGFRPMAADGRPYIGATPVQGLWLNCGHGHLGWTQTCGSGKLLAQLMCGEQPAIAMSPYSLARR